MLFSDLTFDIPGKVKHWRCAHLYRGQLNVANVWDKTSTGEGYEVLEFELRGRAWHELDLFTLQCVLHALASTGVTPKKT